jgi:hypothetical protein
MNIYLLSPFLQMFFYSSISLGRFLYTKVYSIMPHNREEIIGIVVLVVGFFLAVGSWAHNWLGMIGSPAFGWIDLTVCIIGIIMVIVAILIYRGKIKLSIDF